ncbi:unnamed protein product [Phaeothamnion confervicola]
MYFAMQATKSEGRRNRPVVSGNDKGKRRRRKASSFIRLIPDSSCGRKSGGKVSRRSNSQEPRCKSWQWWRQRPGGSGAEPGAGTLSESAALPASLQSASPRIRAPDHSARGGPSITEVGDRKERGRGADFMATVKRD